MNKLTDLSSSLIPDDDAFERMEQNLFQRIDAEEQALLLKHVAPRTGTKRLSIQGGWRRGPRINRTNAARPVADKPKTRRRLTLAGVSVAGTFAVVAVLVASNVLGLAGWRGGADSAAAAVLSDAAVTTIATSDPVVGAGQFLVVKTTAVNGPIDGEVNGRQGFYLAKVNETLYIPHNTKDVWTWVRSKPATYQTFGSDSAYVAKMQQEGILAESGSAPDVLTAAGGAFYESPARYTRETLAALPRDAHQLLNYIYRVTLGTGPSADGEALVYIADTLRSGLVPADLRASFYQAAALIPGVTVTDKQATLDGRTGIAIGRFESKNQTRQDIIIDPATGLMIGEREVSFGDDVPAGTVTDWSAIETSVANSAPLGG